MKKDFKKVWMPIVALCSAGLMVGTGYAAWTISKDSTQDAGGAFVADTVSEANITITNLKWDGNDANENDTGGTICFGWDKNYTAKATDWLTNTEEGKEAKRSSTLTFDVVTTLPSVNVDIMNFGLVDGQDEEKTKAYNSATTAGENQRIVPPTSLTATKGTSKHDDKTNETTTTYTLGIEFSWGTKFRQNNPIEYYNGKTGDQLTDKIKQQAKNDLETISKINGLKFKFTISATKA